MSPDSALHPLDLALRGGVVMLMLFAAALLLRDHPRALAARLAAACGIGVAAYAVCSITGLANAPAAWHAPLIALSTGNTVVFWLWSRALFDDAFRLRAGHVAAWAMMAGLGVATSYSLGPAGHGAARAAGATITLATIGFSLLAVAQTLATWRADLVEGRRRLRVYIVGAGAAYTLAAAALRLAASPAAPATTAPAWASLADAVALAVLVITIVWPLFAAARSDLFAADVRANGQTPGDAPLARIDGMPEAMADTIAPSASSPAREFDPVDPRLLAALDHLMTVEQVYREEGLSIGSLAARLDVPEYRLRRLINQGLGHRNFNAFLNRYRLTTPSARWPMRRRARCPC